MDGIEARLEDFIGSLDRSALATDAARRGNLDLIECQQLLTTYLSEAVVGLRLISNLLGGRPRILEVGSGVGILTAFLKREEFDIVGIEPGANGGFGFMTALNAAIMEQLSPQSIPPIHSIGAEELNPDTHGKFDLIFSVNVMEHVMALADAMKGMKSVLSPRGKMTHLCANYAFPYEPHLGIPLVPFAPAMTRYILPGKVARNKDIWCTLNFITASQVGRLARCNGLSLELERGIMATFFRRLREDPVFAARHEGGLIGIVAGSSMLSSAAVAIFDAMPASLATPMVMTMTHEA